MTPTTPQKIYEIRTWNNSGDKNGKSEKVSL